MSNREQPWNYIPLTKRIEKRVSFDKEIDIRYIEKIGTKSIKTFILKAKMLKKIPEQVSEHTCEEVFEQVYEQVQIPEQTPEQIQKDIGSQMPVPEKTPKTTPTPEVPKEPEHKEINLEELMGSTINNLIKIAKELDVENKDDAAEEVHKVIRKYIERL